MQKIADKLKDAQWVIHNKSSQKNYKNKIKKRDYKGEQEIF